MKKNGKSGEVVCKKKQNLIPYQGKVVADTLTIYHKKRDVIEILEITPEQMDKILKNGGFYIQFAEMTSDSFSETYEPKFIKRHSITLDDLIDPNFILESDT